MANFNEKWEENIPGKYFVDCTCIDCDACRSEAPKNFKREQENGFSFVYKQPETPEEIERCENAMQACPVNAIGHAL